MKHIVIGTAGHIDHGKTTLIKALTGTDTDRLKEEKKRGISIDLGFTYFDLPSGKRAGIIDVPGHEKFIRNMLAGVGGMDIVLLVVAADEGVMPQTKEHLDILSQLKIKRGLIVLTKTSLVDGDWLELIQEDVKEKVKGTFLENAELIPVDSISGKGMDQLISAIELLTEETEGRDINSPMRMPIDRVFSITGFGTVVTGTLTEGRVNLEDTLEILPDHIKVRVRNIQVHGKSVETAYAGQRVAINLANIKKEEIERGQILVQMNSMAETMMIDGKIKVLKDYSRTLKNRDRIRLYHGSTEMLARVVILGQEELQPGEEGFVQLRLEETTAVRKGDHVVVRFYSPMETIGGLIVIDANPKKHKRFDEKALLELKQKEKGTPEEILEKHIERMSREFPDLKKLAQMMGQQAADLQSMMRELLEKGKIVELDGNWLIHVKHFEQLKEQALSMLEDYHQKNPLRQGMLKEELKSKLFPQNKSRVTDVVIEKMVADDSIKITEKFVALKGFSIVFNHEQEQIKQRLESIYLENPYGAPKLEEAVNMITFKAQEVQRVVEAMLGAELIKIGQDVIIHKQALSAAEEKLIAHIKSHGSITLAEFRDLLETSRKQAMVLLEYFDNQRITKRLEDKRILF